MLIEEKEFVMMMHGILLKLQNSLFSYCVMCKYIFQIFKKIVTGSVSFYFHQNIVVKLLPMSV